MSYNFETYTTGSTAYELFAPGRANLNATGSSTNTTANTVTLTFASVTANVGDLILVTGGTYTGNAWTGFRYVSASNATSVTFTMPNTPGTYTTGTVTIGTGLQEYVTSGIRNPVQISSNAATYVAVLTSYANTTSWTAPANDANSFYIPANTVVQLPVRGPALLQVKSASGAVISAVEV